jgi:glyoxylase-like metal-dependent hydrolase (beta-lactamase superfamily II)
MPQNTLNVLSPHIFWSAPDDVRDRPVMGLISGRRGSLIVETGASPAHANQFCTAAAGMGVTSPRYAAVTHWHWDHVFGTAALGLPTIGHVETRRRVLEMASLDWSDAALDARVTAGTEIAFIAEHVKLELSEEERRALVISAPDLTFTGQMEVDLGDLTVRVIHVGGDHASDSCVIYVPEERAVFLGDCYYSGFTGDEVFYTTRRLFPLLDALEALPVEYYIWAHRAEPTPRLRFLKDAARLRRIGELVDQTGADREKALAGLPGVLGSPPNEEDPYTLNAFLRGLEADVA